jgi:hypothetical protein
MYQEQLKTEGKEQPSGILIDNADFGATSYMINKNRHNEFTLAGKKFTKTEVIKPKDYDDAGLTFKEELATAVENGDVALSESKTFY